MAVEKIIEYEHRVFVVETVGKAQFDMYRQIQEGIIAAQDIPDKSRLSRPKRKKKNASDHWSRSLRVVFRFNRSHRLLLEQMEQFPGGTHDDLPDALAGAVDIAGGKRRRKKSYYKKPPGL
ncbi:hypothetical protein P7H22_10610 [Paenibacillus larvae]|nr:hypothetical protein [Paenibacillus larvae]MDT2240694.1 hypothetical protein [Paenibacillus larvae]